MTKMMAVFERIVRESPVPIVTRGELGEDSHPFDERNIHPDIAAVSLKLFDDGHYAQATFEALKYVDNKVKKLSKIDDTGFSLMMNAFNELSPRIKISDLVTMSEKDEQKGFRYMFAGAMAGIRNPRGHDNKVDSVEVCLDHLSLASVLLRTLDGRKAP